MSDPVDPVRPPEERRQAERRARQRRLKLPEPPSANLPVVIAPAMEADAPAPEALAAPEAAFAAQLLGQPGQKRGLRGGPETLTRARSAYLEAQYRGPRDRRIPRGAAAEEEA
jgi:hypothetical protein